MRIPGLSRRATIVGGICLGFVLLVTILLVVVYPKVGAWKIRSKIGDKVAKLDREVRFGAIDVSLGHAVLRDVEIRGLHDGDTPLVHIDRIDIDFDAWKSLVGSIKLGEAKIDGLLVTIHRDAAGQDNIRDVIDHLRGKDDGAATDSAPGPRPTSIAITHGKLLANDELTGATALVADGDATWSPAGWKAQARGVTATTLGAPRASAAKIDIEKVAGTQPIVNIDSGEIALWPKLALTGIGGQIVANPKKPAEYVIDLAGGYGGVPGKLWTAKGGFDPATTSVAFDLVAAKFQLDRLAPILEHSAVADYANTSVDTTLHVDADKNGAKFAGSFHLTGLNVGHPLIAEKEVRDLDLSAQIAGTFDRNARKLEVTQGDFVARNVPFSITGTVVAPGKLAVIEQPAAPPPPPPPDPTDKKHKHKPKDAQGALADATPREPPRRGPHGIQVVKLRLVIPPIDCQKALRAIPPEMVPYMVGYKLHGVFDADIHVDIDWGDLDATALDGHVGIDHCKVTDEPADGPKRLKEEFEHYVELEQGEWSSFIVGPTNADFVPLDEISPYVMKSIMTTEDSAFYQHHGFIPTEFRTAMLNNLKAEKFVQGASSITMQMVKNVLLYREKTLARKLQELFLTWHVENTLDKDRIMEIYLNVIEYGPGLYGIGPAAYHYFGKKAKDLTAREAAFFSTILPDPKGRYKQYCANELTKWTQNKMDRILKIELDRDRITQAEYDTAMATPLLFAKDGLESEEDCLKRVKKAIKNARPTNPLADKKDLPKDKPKPKPHKHDHDHDKKKPDGKLPI